MKSPVKIGTRGSRLALYQAELVRAKLKESFPSVEFELVKIRTKGDQVRRADLKSIGPGIFTREIEAGLLNQSIDLAVHSAKDLASLLPGGLEIGAVLIREDPRDCLVSTNQLKLGELKQGARIGTSSLRRKAQLKRLRSDLEISDMRGNVETRLRKIDSGEYDGLVIAYAGLFRLGYAEKISEIFEETDMLPQAGQGAIAVQCRSGDADILKDLQAVNDQPTFVRVSAERSFLRRLEGGCQLPVGVSSKIEEGRLILTGGIFSPDGDDEATESISGLFSDGDRLGTELAEALLRKGGKAILEEIRNVGTT